MKLFMLIVGATPPGRSIEQHDVFFGVGDHLAALLPQLDAFWPQVGHHWHIDAWREVNVVDGYRVTLLPAAAATPESGTALFFLYLGGYQAGHFQEFHHAMLVAAPDKRSALQKAKADPFFRDYNGDSPNAQSHVDNTLSVGVDAFHTVADLLAPPGQSAWRIHLSADGADLPADELHLGYLPRSKLIQPDS